MSGYKKFSTILLLLVSHLLGAQTEKGVTPIAKDHEASGSTYSVVVGISNYQDEGIPDLRFADKDAEAFAAFLRSPVGGALDDDHLRVLLNEEATQARFAAALDWLWEVAGENDRAIIYFSGHGDVEKKSLTQPGYLLCWDTPSRVYMAGGAFPLNMLQEVISTISVQNQAKVVMIADACRSGKLSGSAVGGAQITGSNLAKQYANEIKLLSCQPDEYSIEGEQWGGGRGAFSYHLIDGLYGMADGNNDQMVNLLEIGRYLEDRVSTEVAPQSQIPMTIGSKAEKLTEVYPNILAELKAGRKGQMQILAATESRGIEDDVLAEADSSIAAMYLAFKKAIKEKAFFEPVSACADFYYEELSREPQLNRLHSSMRRNYAAALQDDAQQVLNSFMKDAIEQPLRADAGKGLKHVPVKVFTEKVRAFPACLERASGLLGKDHYMYATLKARKHFFEGYLLANSDRNPNQNLGGKALTAFRQALDWQPEMPHVFWQMSLVYGYNFLQPDSAAVYARKAMELLPSWTLPYAQLAYMLMDRYKQYDKAKPYLEQVIQMDSSSQLVLSVWGVYYHHQGKFDEAEIIYKKLIDLDSLNPVGYNGLGLVHLRKNRFDQAEIQFKKAIQCDTTSLHYYSNLGLVYLYTQQFDLAEIQYKKAIQLDSIDARNYVNLGNVYIRTQRLEQAESLYKKSIQLDSLAALAYYNLGLVYIYSNRLELAEGQLLKSIQLDSAYSDAFQVLGTLYFQTKRFGLAEENLNKALRLNPASWVAYASLSGLYQNLQRWEESASMAQKAIDFGPPIGEIVAILGNAYTHLGHMEDAKTMLDKALGMSPHAPVVFLGLAHWALKTGQTEQAWQYLEQGLEKNMGAMQLSVEDLQEAPDFIEMRKDPRWDELMKKYFSK